MKKFSRFFFQITQTLIPKDEGKSEKLNNPKNKNLT
jgi:hypothetical protein